jgi:hypothetical protein
MQWMPGQSVLRAQVLETALVVMVVMVVQVQLWLVAWVLLARGKCCVGWDLGLV